MAHAQQSSPALAEHAYAVSKPSYLVILLLNRSIIIIGALVCLGAIVWLIRDPHWLARHGKRPRIHPTWGAAVFALFLFLPPVIVTVFPGLVIASKAASGGGGQVTNPALSLNGQLHQMWVGYLLWLPAIVLWFWARRQAVPELPMTPAQKEVRKSIESVPRPVRSWKASIFAAVIGLAAVFPAIEFVSWVWDEVSVRLSPTHQPPDPLAHETLRVLADSPWSTASLWIVIGAVCVSPVIEEMMFRGTLQAMFRSVTRSPWVGILAVSFFFALEHAGIVEVQALLPLFMLAVVMGAVYEWSGRLTSSILIHAGFNLINTLLTLLIVMGRNG